MASIGALTAQLDKLDKLQMNASNAMNISSSISTGKINSIFSTGVNNAGQARDLAMSQKGSIFDIAKSADTQSASAQSGTTQKAGADASSVLASINNFISIANNSFNNVINFAKDALQANTAEASAMQAPQTTGQTVKPEDNIPTDNQGKENKTATPNDSQKPNVGFGEETVDNKAETGEVGSEVEAKPKDEPKDTPVDNSKELDQKTIDQQEEKKLEEAKKKAEEEARLKEQALTAQA